MFWAWREFKKGKLKKQDIAGFGFDIEEEIFRLHKELSNFSYKHDDYTHFVICDPKRRDVHKASPRDRLLHHAVYKVLWPLFDKEFIYDSFSSRKNKGMHKAHERFAQFAWRLSRNKTSIVWVLKCDIRKFFDSIDHSILINILKKRLDKNTISLAKEIIQSFKKDSGKGIPIGNLTSQLFSNIYLNEFDQFVKRKLQVKHYIRYADDFVILSSDKNYLSKLVPLLSDFLEVRLALSIHPRKIIIRKWHQGIDFLGYIIFPHYKILRTKTKKRILKKLDKLHKKLVQGKISNFPFSQSRQSYLGILKHCRGHSIEDLL
ncbi:MAG: reverse transcriptase/maturase family protein [Patescibacteria group bacterium]